MQSSPPTRAWARPASPAISQYSIDLGALDLDGHSDTSEPAAEPPIDRILSEDIDGPSDFTQNMELYMKGGPLTTRNPTQFLQDHPETKDEDITASHHTPENSPPRDSVFSEPLYEEEDQFSSEWNPHGVASTPAVPKQIQLMQPTVEDYHSELTALGQTPAHTLRGRKLHFQTRSVPEPQKQSASRDRPSSGGRLSSPALSPTRSSSAGHTSSSTRKVQTFDDDESPLEFRQLQTKCDQLDNQNRILTHALYEERRVRGQEKATYDSESAEGVRRERDLKKTLDTAEHRQEPLRQRIEELEGEVRRRENDIHDTKNDVQGPKQDSDAELKCLQERLDGLSLDNDRTVEALQQAVDQAQHRQVQAEETARILRLQLEQNQQMHEAELEHLKAERQQVDRDGMLFASLEQELSTARKEIEHVKARNGEVQNDLEATRAQVIELKRIHVAETSRNLSDRSGAVDLATKLQRQLQELRQKMREDQDAHSADMDRLRTEHIQARETHRQELEVVKAEHEAQRGDFNEAVIERDEAQDLLEACRAEVDDLTAELNDIKAVNTALDESIRDRIEQRDKRWKEILEAAHRERQVMSKTLLHQWGREDLGGASPQAYAYKYGLGKEYTGPEKAKKVS